MKLTKYEKDSIIRAIMQDVPRTLESVLKKEIQLELVKGMSAPIQKLYKTHPNALRLAQISSWDSGLGYRVDLIAGDADVSKTMEPFAARKKMFDDTQAKLSGIVNGCTTLAQLKKLLPEFTSYFPTETEPTKNLPAVANMVADLSKLGWPKGKTK